MIKTWVLDYGFINRETGVYEYGKVNCGSLKDCEITLSEIREKEECPRKTLRHAQAISPAGERINIYPIGKTKIIQKGVIFTVTQGEYSDYETISVCKALVDIDVSALQHEYLKEHPEQDKEYNFAEHKFLAWMVNKKKFAEEIEFHELHLGSYGTADFQVCVSDERGERW